MVCAFCFGAQESGNGGAEGWKLYSDLLDGWGGRLGREGCVGAGVEEQKPGACVAGEDGLDALAIEPAGGFDGG